MEKPVVATDVGGISEQVPDGETGIIIPARNPKAAAEAVIYLLEHPEERIKMGKKGRERVKEMFSLERCVKEHRKLYANIYMRNWYKSHDNYMRFENESFISR